MKIKLKNKLPISFFPFSFFIILSFSGCLSVKTGGVKSGKKLFETFYVGDGATQYFIKPLTFKSKDALKLKIDFTFRYADNHNLDSMVNINYSLFGAELIRSIDSMHISSSLVQINPKQAQPLFSEKQKKGFLSRHNTSITLSELNQLMRSPNWIIEVFSGGEKQSYLPTAKTKKSLLSLDKNVFVLFR